MSHDQPMCVDCFKILGEFTCSRQQPEIRCQTCYDRFTKDAPKAVAKQWRKWPKEQP